MKFLLLFFASTSFAGEISSGPHQVHLLELFSTQSCSSCPPAQNWVSRLRDHPKLWDRFIPVVFHVDYWDYLGWKDPYSRPEFTQRQRKYAASWKASSVYTPAFVLNGSEWRTRGVAELIKKGSKVGELKVESLKGGKYRIRFLSRASGNLVAHGVVLGNRVETDVKAGENSGKKLMQDFLVLKHRSKKMNARREAGLQLASSIENSLVFWVSREGENRPLQVVGSSGPF